MRSRCICLSLLTVVLTSLPIQAQQDPVPSAKSADTQAGNSKAAPNVNLPASTEKWSMPGDIKTGLEPRPLAVVQSDEQPQFVRELLRVQWREIDPIDLWVIRPKVAGKVPEKVPVILYLYSFSDTDQRFRDNGWCQRATADGYAAVGFVSALTDYRFKGRGLSRWFVSDLQESLGSTTHDVQLILNSLAQKGGFDMSRVGMFGLGSGGTIAILAAQADPRITTLDVLDPWGDWPDWVGNSSVLSPEDRTKFGSKEFLQSIATLDPLVYLPRLKTLNIRIQQMLNDPVTPPAAKERISSAAPMRATIVKYQNAEELQKSWQSTGLSGWIKQQLNAPAAHGASEAHVAKNP